MSLADDIYMLYKEELHKSTHDEVSVVLRIFDGQSRKHILQLVEQMCDSEIVQMLGIYLIESLKAKMVKDGNISMVEESEDNPSYMH